MVQYFLERWFEEQLRFRLPDGTDEGSVSIGSAVFSPVEILKEFKITYDQEFNNWLNEVWKPAQHELRQEILSYSGNAGRYFDLKGAIGREQVVPLVGSGMSAPSKLPTWAAFLKKVGEFAQCDLSELELLIRSSAFEKAADLLSTSMNRRLFAERVEQDLRIVNPDVINGPVCLLPGLFPKLVITTNLDNVLETLYRLCNLPFGHTLSGTGLAEYRRLKDARERFLLKLHGDCLNQNGRVLLSSEYDEAYALNSPPQQELTLLYRQYSLLFLGCSLGPDRTVSLIQQVASDDENIPKHYAFLETPYNDEARLAREDVLTQGGIYPIWYDSPHNEAIMALLDGLYPDGTE